MVLVLHLLTNVRMRVLGTRRRDSILAARQDIHVQVDLSLHLLSHKLVMQRNFSYEGFLIFTACDCSRGMFL